MDDFSPENETVGAATPACAVFQDDQGTWLLHFQDMELVLPAPAQPPAGLGEWVVQTTENGELVVCDGKRMKLAANLIQLPRARRRGSAT